jgi:hypothetical protein
MPWFLWLLGVLVLVMWIVAIVSIIQRRHEMSGGKLAAWIIIVLVFPVVGTLIYFLVNGATSSRVPREPDRMRVPGSGV